MSILDPKPLDKILSGFQKTINDLYHLRDVNCTKVEVNDMKMENIAAKSITLTLDASKAEKIARKLEELVS